MQVRLANCTEKLRSYPKIKFPVFTITNTQRKVVSLDVKLVHKLALRVEIGELFQHKFKGRRLETVAQISRLFPGLSDSMIGLRTTGG